MKSVTLIALALAVGVSVASPAITGATNGNNGTLKVHEQGTPSGTESNDPKVCTFNFEGYGFDKGQDGMIVITTQGGGNNKSEVKRVHLPAAKDADKHATYTESEYLTLPNGHYKSTLYGKDNRGEYRDELKAKSKVFKVTCGTVAGTTTEKPADKPVEKPADKPADKPVTKPADKPATTTTPKKDTPATAGTSTERKDEATAPEAIAATGTSPLQALLSTALAGIGVYGATLLRRK